MVPVQEFSNPADLVAHYKALNKRIFDVRVPEIPTPIIAAPVNDKPPVPPNTVVPKYYSKPVYKIPAIANLTTAQINELARRIAEHRAARGFGPVYVSSAEHMAGIKVHDLIRLVETIAGVSAIDILSLRRDATSVKARQIVMWLAKKFTLRTFPEIGNYIGGRDHTTCLHGCNKVQRLINTKFGEPAGSSPEAWTRHLWDANWKEKTTVPIAHWIVVPRPQSLSSGDPA